MGKLAKGSVVVLVGTRKGAFAFRSDQKRKKWSVEGPWFAGTHVHHVIRDARTGGLIAAVNNGWFGGDVHRSADWGKTWKGSDGGVRYPAESGLSVTRIWHVQPGRASEPGVVYAGVEPAGLFRSGDGGATWEEVKGLNQHASREKWTPGGGGLMLHTIVLPEENPKRMYIAISAAGVFRSDDGGATWQPRNNNTRADFAPDKMPEVGQCVHKLVAAKGSADLLYQQNHCGVYRSESGGDDWTDISEGLPSRFGFPMWVNPRDSKMLWVLPHVGAEMRAFAKGVVVAYRSANGGKTWQKQTRGLPAKNAYLTVLRDAMSGDACDSPGVYFGTETGELFFSRNEGNDWSLLADLLPPVMSVEAAVV
jgi:hypothetical protein